MPGRGTGAEVGTPTEGEGMKKATMNAFIDRVAGERPAPPRAAAVAAGVGMAAGVIVYRLLRHEPDE